MLEINNLSKSFGKKSILSDFSYKFNDAGVYVIKGDSGVGKTTLLRIISGLDKEYSGQVIGGGISNVSCCFQEYRLFNSISALKNITEISFDKAKDVDIANSKELLLRLGFSEDEVNLLPSELSGGMKQRVAFARAVMKKSPILILDEPTKEVDSKIRDEMKKIILECASARLVLMVTHNPDDIEGLNAKIIDL